MKIEHIVIIGTIVLVSIISAISVHVTILAEKEDEISAIQEQAATREYWLALQVAELKQQLAPEPYVLPTNTQWISSGCG